MNEFSSEDLMQFYGSNVSTFFTLANEAFTGVQKLAELNLQAGRSVLAEGAARLQEVRPETASADWWASPLRAAEAAAAMTLLYQQHVRDIAVAVQSASAQVVEAQFDQFNRDVMARIDSWAKHAPAGSETAVVAVKAAFSAAGNSAQAVQAARKLVHSVVAAAQANVSTMAAATGPNPVSRSGAWT
ncbi:phasin family protein [Paraburkholderia sp. GAS41]|jgi:phasin family protein|uniref:TIGR01841 family phasin n=1 Tax=Paraburkholderia sp. GAS41 TaxID=3035134 RepID=UPI003D232DBA